MVTSKVMPANSIAPSRRTVDIYLDGADWKLALYDAAGSGQVENVTVGDVDVGTGGVVTLPLNLRSLGGEPANELRVFGGGTIQFVPARPLSSTFLVSEHDVVTGEVLGIEVEKIVAIVGPTRIRIAWGG